MAARQLWELEVAVTTEEPEVSIIVCVHDGIETTMTCIESLEMTLRLNKTSAEVVVVDDASTDGSAAVLQLIRGIKYVRNPVNLGFLKSANVGVGASRGKNVLFLNNDTVVVGTWLDEMMRVLTMKSRAAVVGPKLIGLDGFVQEAGGIVFSDASGWNYGRGMDPSDPRVNFIRQVDYCSGAALLVRGDFLSEIGGFDEQFAPAYYEDTDLCFAARKNGWEVWYQPTATVLHVEGASHGTDVNVGVKRHQAINQEKMAIKWSAELKSQPRPSAESVEAARQRSDRSRIVIIDNEVPCSDRDSGSLRMTLLMRELVALGHAVSFSPLNGWHRWPYTSQLQDMGIEVLSCPSDWLNRAHTMTDVSHVMLSRPHVAEAVIDDVRKYMPGATLIYDTVDLHFLRLDRQANLNKESDSDPSRMLLNEFFLAEKSDVVVVVSERERAIFQGLTTKPVVVVSNIHETRLPRTRPNAGRDVVFVGGFRHSPNEDAVNWHLRDVHPRLHRDLGSEFVIVGSDLPETLAGDGNEGVTVLGWVPDLETVYSRARVAVAPLRYGAGVKGKVGEALSFGIPIVTTSIGAEGIGIKNGVTGLIANTAEEFADAVSRLLVDDELWMAISRSGSELIDMTFGIPAAHHALEGLVRVR